jgi:hypothetical protein
MDFGLFTFMLLLVVVMSIWWFLSSTSEKIAMALIAGTMGTIAYYFSRSADHNLMIAYLMLMTVVYTIAAVRLVLTSLKLVKPY